MYLYILYELIINIRRLLRNSKEEKNHLGLYLNGFNLF